ncbi:MAG: iron ABC transporter substrate-binding protein [Caldilineales bacterium]|nr:iron ABC transporter substrate-binding protein [Caldilineales bacterium]
MNRSMHRSLFILIIILTAVLAACQAPATAPAAVNSPTAIADPEPSADPEPVADPEPDNSEMPDLEGSDLTIYSGRSESLIGPLIEEFIEDTGIQAAVRYGDTAEMAATILEEGNNSPADVYFAQDAGALGALTAHGRLTSLPDDVLSLVDEKYRSADGDWAGISGRARVVVYNTNAIDEAELPDDIWGFTDPAWKGRLGWAPTNGSFQAFVTALRKLEGDDRAREWLEAMLANDIAAYANNTAIVEAVGKGEIDAGFVNHYYLMRFLDEQGESFPARNYYLRSGDAGAMINVAGAGIVNTSAHPEAALAFIRFLLSEEAQTYFATQTEEYPLTAGVSANPALKPLVEIASPDINLNDLQDLEGTLALLQEVGALD